MTMQPDAIIHALIDHHARLWTDGHTLELRNRRGHRLPVSALPADLAGAIRDQKAAIIAYLQSQPAALDARLAKGFAILGRMEDAAQRHTEKYDRNLRHFTDLLCLYELSCQMAPAAAGMPEAQQPSLLEVSA